MKLELPQTIQMRVSGFYDGKDRLATCRIAETKANDYGNKSYVSIETDDNALDYGFDTRYVRFADYEEDIPEGVEVKPDNLWIGFCAYELQQRGFTVVEVS